jgi:hypothetical protein
MSQTRFATARSLFETFPELAAKFTVAPADEPPIDFLRKLSGLENFEQAVAFCAHLLPRRDAVWWACGSVRAFLGDAVQDQSRALAVAEAWVYAPTDQNRRAALDIGTQSDSSDPLTWLALGAGWAGGLLSAHPQTPVQVPPYMTARAARIAILLGARHIRPPDQATRKQACITEGIRLAENGL